VCRDVSERQIELQKCCERAKAVSENANAVAQKMKARQDGQREAQEVGLADLQNQLSALDSRILDIDASIKTQADGLKDADREVQNLRTWTDQLKDLKLVQAEQKELGAALQTHARRLEKTEVNILNLESGPLAAKRMMQDSELERLQETLGATVTEVKQLHRWKGDQKIHNELLDSASNRLRTLEGSCAEALVKGQDIDAQVQGLRERQASTEKRVEACGDRVDSLRSAVKAAGELGESLKSQVQLLQGDCLSERDRVARLTTRVDLCCKYFNGLGKGLQDTHRQITSAEGMRAAVLPPKNSGSSAPTSPKANRPGIGGVSLPAKGVGALPTLPKTPRNTRAAGPPTPRRSAPTVVV